MHFHILGQNNSFTQNEAKVLKTGKYESPTETDFATLNLYYIFNVIFET